MPREAIVTALRFLKEYLTKLEPKRTMQVSLDKVTAHTFSIKKVRKMRYFSKVISLITSLKSTAVRTHSQPNFVEEEYVRSAAGNFHGIRPNQARHGWQYQKRWDWICEDLHKTRNISGCMEASLHLCNTEDVEFLESLRRLEHRGWTEMSLAPIRMDV